MEFAIRFEAENRGELADNSYESPQGKQGVVMLKNNLGALLDVLRVKQALLVGLGGFLGSIARFKMSGVILHRTEALNFPLSTFVVNVTGCLVIGVLAALVEHHDFFSPSSRLFLFTGLLGGFTTFSAFAYEGAFLIRRGMFNVATAYALLSVVAGLVAVWMGMKLVALFGLPHH
jgi:CrcB protein